MSDLFENEHKDRGFDVESMLVADLVNSFKRALIFKQPEMQEYGISIKNVDLTLKTLATTDAGASISLQIPILGKVEFGSKLSEKSLQTTKLTLKPSGNVKMVREADLMDMDKTLAQSISSVIEGVKAAGNQGTFPLELDEATFEFNFILSGDSNITMIIESGFESELSNTLKINFQGN
ncbi:MAG TPA: trypco2 family protein [Methanobacterium sp.]|nr:trypco2 family protein [Methanobacterium sp.]